MTRQQRLESGRGLIATFLPSRAPTRQVPQLSGESRSGRVGSWFGFGGYESLGYGGVKRLAKKISLPLYPGFGLRQAFDDLVIVGNHVLESEVRTECGTEQAHPLTQACNTVGRARERMMLDIIGAGDFVEILEKDGGVRESAWEAAWSEGRRLSPEAAVEKALGQSRSSTGQG